MNDLYEITVTEVNMLTSLTNLLVFINPLTAGVHEKVICT